MAMIESLYLVERSRTFVRIHDAILNAVGIINQIHGCEYDYCYGNPCTVSFRLGWYACRYYGDVIAQWQWCDVDAVECAYDVVKSLANALWLVRRAGKLRN